MFVVDPKKFGPAMTEQIVAAVKQARLDPKSQPADRENMVPNYLAAVAPRFEFWTGKKPAGIPVWVPVKLAARDKLVGSATAEVGFFVDVPIAPAIRAAGGQP